MPIAPEKIPVPDAAALELELAPYRTAAYSAIGSVADYSQAAQHLLNIAQLRRRIVAEFEPSLTKAEESVKAARATKASIQQIVDRLLNPLDAARQLLETSRGAFERRQEAEALVREAEERLQAQLIQEHKQEALAALGFDDAPEEVSIPVLVHIPAAPALPKTSGVFTSGRWSAEVTDLTALIQAVAQGQAPKECLMANTSVLNRLAQASRSTLHIPGVRAVHKKHGVTRI